MRLKVIEAPDDAEQLYYNFDQARPEYLRWVDVDTLPDAPEKRVIELPADLLEKLTVEKENASGLLGFFDMDGHSAEIMNWLSEFLPEPDNSEPENIAADWYLDHVEFVKKEPNQYYLRAPRKSPVNDYSLWFTDKRPMDYSLYLVSKTEAFDNLPSYTDEEIAKLAEKFPEINFDALEKVKVEE